ncbi:MAG: GrpB family protein, partial [Bacteroidota bacterium]
PKQAHDVLDKITHHLYVCPAESKALERHLLMRNFLRKHEWARLKYQDMKYNLAAKAHQDQKRYAQLKEAHCNDFIDTIIEKEKEILRTKNSQHNE